MSAVERAATLIALCARPETVDEEELRERVLAPLDWNRFLVEALWHKVAFLAYESLAACGLLDAALTEGTLPLLLLNHWKQLHRVNRRRNRIYLGLAAEISAALTEAGVDHAVGKGGPLLIGRAYAIGERKMYDIDFIAPRARLREIEEVFAGLGFEHGEYRHATGEIRPLNGSERRQWLLHARGLPNFLKRLDDEIVDLAVAQVQFKIGSTAAGPVADAEVLLARARRLGPLRAVDEADLLLQLILHIARETSDAEFAEWHTDWNLIKLCDLDRFLSLVADPPVRAEFVERAAGLGFLAQGAHALAAVHAVFPSPAAADLLASIGKLDPEAAAAAERTAAADPVRRVAELLSHTAETSQWTKTMGRKTS